MRTIAPAVPGIDENHLIAAVDLIQELGKNPARAACVKVLVKADCNAAPAQKRGIAFGIGTRVTST